MISSEEQPKRKRKTVLRTTRLAEDTADALDAAAEADGTTFNALASSIINEYVTWVRRARKYGFASVSKAFLKLLLDVCPEEKVKTELARGYAGILRDEMIYWNQEISPKSLVRLLSEHGQHGLYMSSESKIEGREYVLTIQSELGPRFSAMLIASLDGLVRKEFRAQPAFEEGERSLIVRFPTSVEGWPHPG
jgi:hypothetical protein